jgi:hypothetical protein
MLAVSALAACGDDTETGDKDMGGADSGADMIRCVAGELYNPATQMCDPIFPDDDMPVDQPGAPDDGVEDMGPDLPVDMGPDIDPACDKDNDGDLTPECGGTDCDDNNNRRNGRNLEICDEFDNDCDSVINNGITCEFFAHTGNNTLYSIDPFKKTATELAGDLPRFLDIDTHPDGTLYGVTAGALFRKRPFGDWEEVGMGLGIDFRDAQVNGLAIDNTGVVYATGGNNLFRIGIQTGLADTLGSTGPGNVSSGDCVVNKGNNFFMTSKQSGAPDRLIQVVYSPGPGDTVGTTSSREVGVIGFTSVYGLTAAWGRLFGLTVGGELIEIDQATGAGTLIHKFNGRSWYGAASTPAR